MSNPTSPHTLVFNTTVSRDAPLDREVEVARRAGYTGIETTADKIVNYLHAGHSRADLERLLDGLTVYGIGTILDTERHGDRFASLKADAERIFEVARMVGAKGVQVITGPLDYRSVIEFDEAGSTTGYAGVLGYEEDQQLEITANNLGFLADMVGPSNIVVYLEALAWTPLRTLRQQIALLERAGRPNLKLVIDYWHLHTAGDTPADVAALDKNLIYGVHLCDGLPFQGGVPNEVILRDIPAGQGVIDLRQWTRAVKATGYDDWWASETFCRRQQQRDPHEVAPELKRQLAALLSAE
jgi:sugar phosphate isomerase/epimerase